MIRIVTAGNRGNYAGALIGHYRLRHDIYVGERRWMELKRPDGLERDQFDTDAAIYVLAIDGDQVVGGSRLIPTVNPHLLSEVFPHLCQPRGAPIGKDIYEWTRVHVAKERREGKGGGKVLGQLLCGLLEFCLDEGVTSLTALVEMWWLPRFHEMGWTIRPLGLPELIEGEWSVAVQMPIDHHVLTATRRFFGMTGRVLEPNIGMDEDVERAAS